MKFKFRENIGRTLLIFLIFLTVTFIFVQSILSKQASTEQSEAVSGWLSLIVPTTTPLGAFINENIRKIAHFVEFGALGGELCIYALVYCTDKRRSYFITQLAVFFVAFFDETLQIFSGRGPSVADVWLDFSGSVTVSLIFVTVYLIFKKVKEGSVPRG